MLSAGVAVACQAGLKGCRESCANRRSKRQITASRYDIVQVNYERFASQGIAHVFAFVSYCYFKIPKGFRESVANWMGSI